jgi:phosphonate transport system substrate-binding protein
MNGTASVHPSIGSAPENVQDTGSQSLVAERPFVTMARHAAAPIHCLLQGLVMPRTLARILLALSLLTVVACSDDNSAGDVPETLKMGVPPGEADPELLDSAEQVGDLIEEATGIPVEVTQTSDYLGIVEAMRSGLLDIALFSPMPTILAESVANTDTLVVALGSPYTSNIICRPDAGVTELGDIADRSIAFVDPGSTSGNFVPRLMLQEAGLDLDSLDATFAGGHDVAAISVKQGSTDCAAVASLLLPALLDAGAITEDDFDVIAESDTLPISLTIIARDGLSTEVTSKITEQLLESQSPQLLGIARATELVAADEADWSLFYDIAEELDIELEDVE